MQVQNKLKLAETLLPQEVQQQGVNVVKTVRNFIMVIGFYSEDGSMNRTDIADYVAANVLEILSRVPGVGELTLSNAVCNADLARPGQVEQLQAHARGCWCRHSVAERADLPDNSVGCRPYRAAIKRDHIGTRPAADAAQFESIVLRTLRCHGAAARRGPRRAGW